MVIEGVHTVAAVVLYQGLHFLRYNRGELIQRREEGLFFQRRNQIVVNLCGKQSPRTLFYLQTLLSLSHYYLTSLYFVFQTLILWCVFIILFTITIEFQKPVPSAKRRVLFAFKTELSQSRRACSPGSFSLISALPCVYVYTFVHIAYIFQRERHRRPCYYFKWISSVFFISPILCLISLSDKLMQIENNGRMKNCSRSHSAGIGEYYSLCHHIRI